MFCDENPVFLEGESYFCLNCTRRRREWGNLVVQKTQFEKNKNKPIDKLGKRGYNADNKSTNLVGN